MAAPTVVIDSTGIHVPTYEEVLVYFQNSMRGIYGNDIYLEADSQDGQFIGIVADAVNAAFQTALAVYNSYSPQTAQGAGLSNAVKINGLTRRVPSHSLVDIVLGGDANTLIVNGVVSDTNNVRWRLPASVTIPGGGTIIVEASSEETGAIQAPANTLTIIATPVRGWYTATNPLAADPGIPTETDAELRIRQAYSTELPSEALLEGLLGAILSLDAVTYARIYENDTNITDSNGLPPHSISLVVQGGLDSDIAETIYNKKTPGCYTYGSTVYNYENEEGIVSTIRWYEPTDVPIKIEVTLAALTGYSTVIGDEIKQSIVDYITGLEVGDDVYWSRLFSPANLPLPNGGTYAITLLRLALVANAFGTANLVMTFVQKASLTTANVTLIVV